MADIQTLRKAIITNLKLQGFHLDRKHLVTDSLDAGKEGIRALHRKAYLGRLEAEKTFVEQNYERLSQYFADGASIDIRRFSPVVHLVEGATELASLFRFATLLWSVPVSQGFGRRLRFVVLDSYNGKLVGLFALGDPVFNLRVRDQWIGWSHEMRSERLYNVMDLYVVGAVPPYSQLLCGKLMAMLATTDEVRKLVWRKYSKTQTVINKESKLPHLVLLTTSSALGRSSLYNRIKVKGRHLFMSIGKTTGWGHFHLSDRSFALMRQFLDRSGHPINKANRFGQGPNWKIRAIRTCLEMIGLPSDLLMHGIRREVYVAPLADNYREVLLGKSRRPHYYGLDEESIVEFFVERWFIPRATRSETYKETKANDVLRDINPHVKLV